MLFILLLLLAVVEFVANGWVLSILWSWFMVEAFGLPILSIPLAIGICIIYGFLTFKASDSDSVNDFETIFKMLFILMFKAGFFLLSGYIVKGFI